MFATESFTVSLNEREETLRADVLVVPFLVENNKLEFNHQVDISITQGAKPRIRLEMGIRVPARYGYSTGRLLSSFNNALLVTAARHRLLYSCFSLGANLAKHTKIFPMNRRQDFRSSEL
ncbi:hypothetical protein VNO80_15862 [Phaseolus coccineus]|uniref:Uncharacterized protein n=1 Tax=Phaseolus coccineus TaxID=3886 RepID=A0AAN9MR09_PHACN